MKVFLDTNIILDSILERQPYRKHSDMIFKLSNKFDFSIYVSSNSITDIYYIVKRIKNNDFAKSQIKIYLNYITILNVDEAIIKQAINSEFDDFEDAVQYFTALKNDCTHIITRNKQDFSPSTILVQNASEFISEILN